MLGNRSDSSIREQLICQDSSEEEISDDVVFSRVKRLLKDVKKIPVVPGTFSAANPPKQVLDKSSRFIEIEYFIIVSI